MAALSIYADLTEIPHRCRWRELETLRRIGVLVVVGDGSDLFAPLSADLDLRTAQALEAWPHRTFLSLRPVAAWSDRELAMLDSGMALATASRYGLQALGAPFGHCRWR